jgi:cellulose synthase/poly-beta-1,6-N-acetylglucosamine synthase-like glycosyltransferase
MDRVIALIPSHNEEALLPAAIRALEEQTTAPARIVVVSDNSTDRTTAIAAEWGGTVSLFETHGNRDRKAGALNQALATLLPELAETDWVLVVDADSSLAPGFIARALAAAAADPGVGAVGGIFLAENPHTVLERMQALEYVRYAREISRDRARARVLTGTATLVRVAALRAISQARANATLPGGGGIYHPRALCEDFELTVALKRLGYRCISPKDCIVRTEVMPTLGQLWRQRTRWQRGALQCIAMHGASRVTLPYLRQQAGMTMGLIATALLWLVTAWSLWSGMFDLRPFWCLVGLVFYAERVVSAWRADGRGRLLAACALPDLLYDYLIGAVNCFVWVQVALRREGKWGLSTIDASRTMH